MEKSEAYLLLAIQSNANPSAIAKAYQQRKEDLSERARRAPTDALRLKYEAALQQVESAYLVLSQHSVNTVPSTTPNAAASPHTVSTPLSHTQISDLPGITQMPDEGATGLAPGQILLGRYELLRIIGRGGMGEVWTAEDRLRNECVAIKCMLPALTRNEEGKRRFVQEAKAALALSHPGIVRVFDLHQDTGIAFLSMEFLQGRNLRQELEETHVLGKLMAPADVIPIIISAARALSYAHSEGVIHRDIKPENIYLSDNYKATGGVKILDFGIARMASGSRFTQTAMAMGTAYYMAPEQHRAGTTVDGRADQYALAAVAYEALTGHVPAGVFRTAAERRPDGLVTPQISKVIETALQSNPADRYANMAAFANALESTFTQSKPIRAVPRWAAPVTVLALLGAVAILYVTGALSGAKSLIGFAPQPQATPAAISVTPKVLQPPHFIKSHFDRESESVSLGWQNKNPDANLTYQLERSESGSNDEFITLERITNGKTLHSDKDQLVPGQKYWYRIRALSKDGTASAYSDTIFVQLPDWVAEDAATAEQARKQAEEAKAQMELDKRQKEEAKARAEQKQKEEAEQQVKQINQRETQLVWTEAHSIDKLRSIEQSSTPTISGTTNKKRAAVKPVDVIHARSCISKFNNMNNP